jgi:L-alanine-DL-glutamate epimerase-like enolase superfamily enzyme
VTAIITDLLALELVGQDPTHIAGLCERMYRSGFYFGRNGVISAAISAVEIAGGRVQVPTTPGLGIAVDEQVVREYRVQAFPRK